MESSTFLQDLSIVSPIVTSALSVYLLSETGRQAEKIHLALCTTLLSLFLWCRYLFYSGSILLPLLPLVGFPVSWFVGPLLYKYVLRRVHAADKKLSMLLPGSLALISAMIHGVLLWSNPDLQTSRVVIEHDGFLANYTATFVLLVTAFNISYVVFSLIAIRAHSSPDEHPGEQKALLILVILLGIYTMLHMILAVLGATNLIRRPFHPIEALASLALAYCFVHVSLKYSMDEPSGRPPKYAKQSMNSADASRYLESLRNYMAREKPYLEEGLTLQQLAKNAEIPPHHLSMVINSRLSMNFFSFVNSYRVEEAIQLMRNPEYSDHTLLQIAFEAGFQSKAAFNTAFKRQTGLAPGDFRKRLKEVNP